MAIAVDSLKGQTKTRDSATFSAFNIWLVFHPISPMSIWGRNFPPMVCVLKDWRVRQEHNIAIEILANDDGNVKDDKKYLIKGFNDSFKGRVKSNIVAMLDKFGGENEDGDAIRAALPHLRKWVHRMKSQVDRLSSLMLFISDSTTESADTRQAVEQARQFTPFEGTAITPEGDIPAKVKYHFGPNSVVPKTIEDFPSVIQEILQRHISRLKPKE